MEVDKKASASEAAFASEAAGRRLADARWWRALSPAACAYVARRLADEREIAVARALPAGKRAVGGGAFGGGGSTVVLCVLSLFDRSVTKSVMLFC